MVKRTLYIALAFVAGLFVVPACSGNHEGHEHHDHETHSEHDHEHEHGHEHGESGEHEEHEDGVIVLEPERAEKLGVGVENISPAPFAEVLAVSGQVMPSPDNRVTVAAKSSGIVTFAPGITEGSKVGAGSRIATVSAKGIAGGDSNEAAKIAYEAAKRELERIRPLAEDGIVSKKDFNAAAQTYEQAKAAYSGSASGSAAVAVKGGVVSSLLVRNGEYVEAGTPIAEISGAETVVLRADIPEKNYSVLPDIVNASFRTGSSDKVFDIAGLGGRRVAEGAVGAAVAGYIPVYFSFRNNGAVAPGAYAEVFLLGKSREGIVSVPVEALYEQQGQKFVFVRLDEDCYDKRPVTVGQNNGHRVEILSGLAGGEDVVTKGVTFVRLAESQGAVPEGHSHSHSH